MLLYLIALSLLTAVPCLAKDKNGFVKSYHSVSWRGQKLKGVERRSFKPSCPAEIELRKGTAVFCASDAKSFFLGLPSDVNKEQVSIQIFERGTLNELGKNHFQLGQTVYFRDLAHPLEGADFATFNELEEESESGVDSRRVWASDHREVFCRGKAVPGLSPKELSFWPFLSWDCKDLVPAPSGNLPATGYIKDASNVFVYEDCKLHMKLKDVDVASFTVPDHLFPNRARDAKGHVYNCGKLTPKKRR